MSTSNDADDGHHSPSDIAAAYSECERIMRAAAKNFQYGIRLLAPEKRGALAAVYAYARRIDDIGDGTLPAPEKLRLLDDARREVKAIGSDTDDPVLIALADAAGRLPIPLPAFLELIDGCELDVRGANCPTFPDLVHYCRCVAGSIGRLSTGVFEASDPVAADPLADTLGVALQLTNILRDIREDLHNGRVYLPQDELDAAGVELRLDAGGNVINAANGAEGSDPATGQTDVVDPRASRASREVVRRRPAVAAHARRSKRCLLLGDGRHLSPSPRADRARSRGCVDAADFLTCMGKGLSRGAQRAYRADDDMSRVDVGDRPTVVVVGGGLAGLSAAVAAADAGWAVTLLESRTRLGGATHSFARAFGADSLDVDNGQHVFLRCCTAYRDFLRRLGVEEQTSLQQRLDVPVVDPSNGRRARLRRDRLPAPLHLSRALLGYRLLTPMQRLRAVVACTGPQPGRPSRCELGHDDVSRLAGSPRPVGCGDRATLRRVHRRHLERPRRRGLTHAGRDGVPRRPAPTKRRLRHRDSARAARASCTATPPKPHWSPLAAPFSCAPACAGSRPNPSDRWRVETDDTAIEADAVVLAVPHHVAADLLPDSAVDEPGAVRGLEVAPIINVHVVFDRVVLHEPFVGAVGSPVQFVFDRTVQSGLAGRNDGGQYVAVSVSAADAWIDEPVERLREIFLPELARVLPAAGDAVVRDFFVTREREATFRPVPGSAARRLPTDDQRCRAWLSPGRGPTPAGRPRWKALCAAASRPRMPSNCFGHN